MTLFRGFRFPPEVILWAVRWYLRFALSFRDLPHPTRFGQSSSRCLSQRWTASGPARLARCGRPPPLCTVT